ncbi:hypothetical protein OAA86_01845 [Rhodospirillales bacterium]|nr:hypothetical protein [Rhodospirillales bacterium]
MQGIANGSVAKDTSINKYAGTGQHALTQLDNRLKVTLQHIANEKDRLMTQEKRRRVYDETTVNDVKGRNADGIFHVKASRPLREAVDYLAEKILA